MNAMRLAGVTPTRDGYRIAPAPAAARRSTCASSASGVAREPGVLRGYVTPERDGPIELRVRRAGGGAPQAFADGAPVPHTVEGGYAVFTARGRRTSALDWALVSKGV